MFLLVISVIHTNNILKIQKGLLSGKSTLLAIYLLWLRMEQSVMSEDVIDRQQCPWHFIDSGNQLNEEQSDERNEMPRVNCIKTYSDGVQLGLTYASHL